MSVAADVFVPFFFNSPPQLLHVSAPLANALGEVKLMRDNEFERRARRAEMYATIAASNLSCTLHSLMHCVAHVREGSCRPASSLISRSKFRNLFS